MVENLLSIHEALGVYLHSEDTVFLSYLKEEVSIERGERSIMGLELQ